MVGMTIQRLILVRRASDIIRHRKPRPKFQSLAAMGQKAATFGPPGTQSARPKEGHWTGTATDAQQSLIRTGRICQHDADVGGESTWLKAVAKDKRLALVPAPLTYS